MSWTVLSQKRTHHTVPYLVTRTLAQFYLHVLIYKHVWPRYNFMIGDLWFDFLQVKRVINSGWDEAAVAVSIQCWLAIRRRLYRQHAFHSSIHHLRCTLYIHIAQCSFVIRPSQSEKTKGSRNFKFDEQVSSGKCNGHATLKPKGQQARSLGFTLLRHEMRYNWSINFRHGRNVAKYESLQERNLQS